MLEPYAVEVARTVLRGGWCSNVLSLPARYRGRDSSDLSGRRSFAEPKKRDPESSLRGHIHTLRCNFRCCSLPSIRLARLLLPRRDGGIVRSIVVRTQHFKFCLTNRKETGGLRPANGAIFFWELDVLPS